MKLIIEDDQGRRTVVPVVGDEMTIGRNEGNAVRLGERNVSRRHGRLVREAGRLYIEDLRSLTGIRVNGERVAGRRPVEEGDRIRISDYDLTLEPEPGEKPAARPGGAQPAVEVAREMRARLLGISGSYRGATLLLDRSPLRIGSASDNDVVVHHPSVSRGHLRLQLVGGSWRVMDAAARNSVRIDGKPWEGIALRHGDVVEIGYLRFAFADAGRELVLPPEFAPMSVPPAQARRQTMPIKTIVGLLAVLLAGALFLRRPADDGGGEVEVLQDAKAERTLALRAAQEALQDHRYLEAQQRLEAARRFGVTASGLKDGDAVQDEARGEKLFRDLESAVGAGEWERAHELASSLGSSRTWYGAQAAALTQAATAGYVATHLAAAAALAGKDDAACLAEARLALDADAQSARAAQLSQSCSVPAVRTEAVIAPAVRAAPVTDPVPAGQRPIAAARSTNAEARKLVREGSRKLMAEDLPGAIALYQEALVLKPRKTVLAPAYRGLGVAFTRQGNIEEGAHYYKLYLPLCDDPAEKAQLQKLLDDYDARRR